MEPERDEVEVLEVEEMDTDPLLPIVTLTQEGLDVTENPI